MDFVVADGDTKGPKKFISKQAEIVGDSWEGKAEYVPDIGHFIKCISNAFFALATKHSELRGKNLLEPTRIKALCGDLLKYLREYGEFYKAHCNNDSEKELVDKERKRAMQRIANLVNHHCGDHDGCEVDDCLYRQAQNNEVTKYENENGGDKSRDGFAYVVTSLACSATSYRQAPTPKTASVRVPTTLTVDNQASDASPGSLAAMVGRAKAMP